VPRYYGMYLDVKERLGIVFGGDAHEGERKVNYLLECGATVKLFSPDDEISEKLRAQADDGEIEWINRKYQAGDLAGAWIVIVADTSSVETNEAISREATERNILLNVMDVTPLCTWIAPALIHRNDITLAVSTAGTSPALARRLREEITSDSCQCMRWANVGPILTDVRKTTRSQKIVCCPEKWQWFMTPEWLDKAEKLDPKQAKADLIEGIKSVACVSCTPFGSCQRIETPLPKH
jgi:precorrin-2 dehydrogenase/sirohydrochlorin ferrochelatase